jgi:adenine deaminase
LEGYALNFHQPWTLTQLREQAAVVKGEALPTKVLKGGTFLNAFTKSWEQANIWILGDRIVYVGGALPRTMEGIEVTDCTGLYLVPGYVEPHAHPFQLYNPVTLASYAATRGTTTLINDNILFFTQFSDSVSFNIIDQLDKELPTSLYWWCRFDNQTASVTTPFTDERITRWLSHPLVVQGGELTDWPAVLGGNDQMLGWLMETRAAGKQIEGHLPGASEKTLTQLALLGVTADHEAMTAEEAFRRLKIGLSTSLRYSSIRPDLPFILKGLLEKGLKSFDSIYMTTDGGTPGFIEQGLIDRLIEIALEAGVPPIEAYMMGTSNPARHYGLNRLVGELAPGRFAHINFLSSPERPLPVSVLAKGEWVKKDCKVRPFEDRLSLSDVFKPLDISWDLNEEWLEPTSSMGIEMENAVISRPFEWLTGTSEDELPEGVCYLTFIDSKGKWRVSTVVKGFADRLSGFASSYSGTGDFILIGRKKSDVIRAFNRVKEMRGGLVITENGEILSEIHLPLKGYLSNLPMSDLIEEDKSFTAVLREKGYRYEDPFYSLNFFSAIHLPYIRVTQTGLYEVMKRQVLEAPTRII